MRAEDIEDCIVELLRRRSPEASICPSDVARSLSGEDASWRRFMEPVRNVAAQLAQRKIVRVTQGSQEVDLSLPVKGPVRIRRGTRWDGGPPG